METYLAEARRVAQLSHPNIVSVYDVGRTDDGSVYLVSEFIDGHAEDADFFLDLLPGPCTRDGLPESIGFWKRPTRSRRSTWVCCTVHQVVASPCWSRPDCCQDCRAVLAIYLEATLADTEARTLTALRKHFPNLPQELGLVEILTHLRRLRKPRSKGDRQPQPAGIQKIQKSVGENPRSVGESQPGKYVHTQEDSTPEAR